MKTAFTTARVPLGRDLEFVIDGNSKITAENGTADAPAPNALSLPHISTCPGSTPVCREGCYVNNLERAGGTYADYVNNERVLHCILMTPAARGVGGILASWIRANVTSFRWHVSGDIFSTRYARWINGVCEDAPEVRFWIYTRTFAALPHLTAFNLVVNISADASNIDRARAASARYGHRVCYFTRDGSLPELPEGSVVFPDYPLRGRDLEDPASAPWWQGLPIAQRRMVCPADFFGQSEAHRCGPCRKCLV